MSTQKEIDGLYMGIALGYSQLSKAKRAKVGACLVTKNGITLGGFNGSAVGTDNNLEHVINGELVTKPSTIHAELNAVLKAAREGVSCLDSTMYTSLSPCVQCSAMLINAGVKRVVYLEEYRDDSGVELLKSAGVTVDEFSV
jgi:dCMP deaminase